MWFSQQTCAANCEAGLDINEVHYILKSFFTTIIWYKCDKKRNSCFPKTESEMDTIHTVCEQFIKHLLYLYTHTCVFFVCIKLYLSSNLCHCSSNNYSTCL